MAERALRTGGIRAVVQHRTWTLAAWVTVFADRPDLARSFGERELVTARRKGQMREDLRDRVHARLRALRRGDIPTAVSSAQAVLAIWCQAARAWGHGINPWRCRSRWTWMRSSRRSELPCPSMGRDDGWQLQSLLTHRAQLRTAQGRLDEAALDLDELRLRAGGGPPGLRTFDDSGAPSGRSSLIVAVRSERARAWRRRARVRAGLRGLGYLGSVLRTAAAVGEPEQGWSCFTSRSRSWRPPVPARVRALAGRVGSACAAARRACRGAEPLAEGLDLAYRCGGGAVVTQALADFAPVARGRGGRFATASRP